MLGIMRFILLIIATVGSLRLLFGCGAETSDESLRLRVIWERDPQHESTVSWLTPASVPSSKIYYDTASHAAIDDYQWQMEPESQAIAESRLFSQRALPMQHHARLLNLQPGTTYYFRVARTKGPSEEFSFRTAPEGNRVTLLFGGDSRSDRSMRRKMNELVARLMQADNEIAGLVHGGDYVADGKNWAEWSEWLTDQEELVRDGSRLLPIIPTRGNHETDKELFNQIWNRPGEGKDYFAQRYGKAGLLILNTEESLSGDQFQWMESQLQGLKDAHWIIANYHKPAYPVVKMPSAARGIWVPLFEKYLVDLVFESDGHAFKRTTPIFQEAKDELRGIIYAGEGGMGVKQRTPQTSLWYIADGGIALKAHHVLKLRIDEQNAVLETFGEDMQILDSYTLRPKLALRQQTEVKP